MTVAVPSSYMGTVTLEPQSIWMKFNLTMNGTVAPHEQINWLKHFVDASDNIQLKQNMHQQIGTNTRTLIGYRSYNYYLYDATPVNKDGRISYVSLYFHSQRFNDDAATMNKHIKSFQDHLKELVELNRRYIDNCHTVYCCVHPNPVLAMLVTDNNPSTIVSEVFSSEQLTESQRKRLEIVQKEYNDWHGIVTGQVFGVMRQYGSLLFLLINLGNGATLENTRPKWQRWRNRINSFIFSD